MQKNIGTMDAIMRITCGLTGVAWATSRMVRHPRRGLPVAVAMMGAMKVAEGVTRFCPLLKLMGTNTVGKAEKKSLSVESRGPVPLQDSAYKDQ